MSKRLFLIDGSSFCYRAFYAIRHLSTSKGQPTNAVYGVVAMLRKLLQEEHPDYLAVAFDLPKPTFRHLRYESYKIHRKPMPDPLVDQLPWIKQTLRAYRIPLFEQEGYEADDILATLALRARDKGWETFLVTGDKDMLQLVGPKIKVYRATPEGHEILDHKTLEEKWGLKPEQVVELMALMGDSVDAIPGLPGVGEKTAVELVKKFGSVEKLLKAVEKDETVVRPAVAKAIRENKDQLKMSRELASLDPAVPLEEELEQLKVQEPDRQELRRIFQTLEFRKLANELTPDEPCKIAVKRLQSAAEMKKLLPQIRKAGGAALLLAAQDAPLLQSAVAAAGLSWGEGEAVVWENPDLKELRFLLEDEKLRKIVPGLKEHLFLLEREGLDLKGPCLDPSLASYLLDPARPSHRIEDLALEFLDENLAKCNPVEGAARKAEAAWRIMPRLEKEIKEKDLAGLLEEVELPLSRVLARMEFFGINIDRQAFEDLAKEMQRDLERLTGEICREAGGEFNINSPKQLGQVLFERLKLPIIKRTKTGASTDEEVLRRLALLHDLPRKLLEFRELSKLCSTYVEAIPRLADPKTGRIHASFNQTVTATGRLSSSSPNLQNLPIRTELGRQIRRGFIPSQPDGYLVAADYSQIELRILAHLSGDEALTRAFQSGQDIHRVTAAEIFNVPPEKVTGDQRAVAKTINFGVLYGMSPFGLAKELQVDQAQAAAFIERYFGRYPRVREFLDRLLEEARRRGYCVTLLNRRRYIPELSAKEMTMRQFAERMAINAPIQGSAADIIKVAMVMVDRRLREQGMQSRMVCQVHDELIFDVPKKELEPARELVKEVMESPVVAGRPIRLKVPIEVNVGFGRNWLEASHS